MFAPPFSISLQMHFFISRPSWVGAADDSFTNCCEHNLSFVSLCQWMINCLHFWHKQKAAGGGGKNKGAGFCPPISIVTSSIGQGVKLIKHTQPSVARGAEDSGLYAAHPLNIIADQKTMGTSTLGGGPSTRNVRLCRRQPSNRRSSFRSHRFDADGARDRQKKGRVETVPARL